jgi:hypothetical protein
MAVAAQLVLGLLGVLASRLALVYDPTELDYGEGVVLWQITQLNDLASAFRPVGSYPFITFNYPPVYHVAVRLFGVFVDNWLIAGRWVSLVATVLAVAFSAVLLWRSAVVTLQNRSSALLVTLFTCLALLQMRSMDWSPVARVDILGVALILGAYVLVSKRWHSVGWMCLVSVLLALAVYTKQTFIFNAAALVAVQTSLHRRNGLILAGLTATIGLTALAILQIQTGGYFLPNMINANITPYRVTSLLSFWNHSGITPPAVKTLGLASLWIGCTRILSQMRRNSLTAWQRQLRNQDFDRTELLCISFVFSGILVALLSGKDGASFNYFLEFDVGICLLGGFLLTWVIRHTAPSSLWTWGAPVAFTFIFLMFLQTSYESLGRLNEALGLTSGANARRVERFAADEKLMAFIEETPGLVLSENMTALVMSGKQVVVEPAAFPMLSKTGQWDPAILAEMIRERRFSAIVMRVGSRRRYTTEIMREINTVYSRGERIGSTYGIYLP